LGLRKDAMIIMLTKIKQFKSALYKKLNGSNRQFVIELDLTVEQSFRGS